jgi:hypothetical protein
VGDTGQHALNAICCVAFVAEAALGQRPGHHELQFVHLLCATPVKVVAAAVARERSQGVQPPSHELVKALLQAAARAKDTSNGTRWTA